MSRIFLNESQKFEFCKTKKKLNLKEKKKNQSLKLFNECNMSARLVDLPNIQLFVIVNTFVDFIGFMALGGASVHNFRDFRWSAVARLTHHFANQIINLVGR